MHSSEKRKREAEMCEMQEEYDFSDSWPNPYAEKLCKPVTLNLNMTTIEYFQDEAARTGIPFQTVISLYLSECAESERRPALLQDYIAPNPDMGNSAVTEDSEHKISDCHN